MAGATASMPGTITTIWRGLKPGSRCGPPSRASNWSCSTSSSRTGLWAAWNTTERSAAAGGAGVDSAGGTRSRMWCCTCSSQVPSVGGPSSNRSMRGSANRWRVASASSNASSWRMKSRLCWPQALSSGWPWACMSSSGTWASDTPFFRGRRWRWACNSSRPAKVSAQWKRQGLGTASSTWVWGASAASRASVLLGSCAMPNTTTRRATGRLPGSAWASAASTRWCNWGRVACRCSGDKPASNARHNTGCHAAPGGRANAAPWGLGKWSRPLAHASSQSGRCTWYWSNRSARWVDSCNRRSAPGWRR